MQAVPVKSLFDSPDAARVWLGEAECTLAYFMENPYLHDAMLPTFTAARGGARFPLPSATNVNNKRTNKQTGNSNAAKKSKARSRCTTALLRPTPTLSRPTPKKATFQGLMGPAAFIQQLSSDFRTPPLSWGNSTVSPGNVSNQFSMQPYPVFVLFVHSSLLCIVLFCAWFSSFSDFNTIQDVETSSLTRRIQELKKEKEHTTKKVAEEKEHAAKAKEMDRKEHVAELLKAYQEGNNKVFALMQEQMQMIQQSSARVESALQGTLDQMYVQKDKDRHDKDKDRLASWCSSQQNLALVMVMNKTPTEQSASLLQVVKIKISTCKKAQTTTQIPFDDLHI